MLDSQGPLPEQIYRRRRFAAVGAGLVVLIVVIILIAVSCGGGSDEPTAAVASSSEMAAEESGAPSSSTSASATPSGSSATSTPAEGLRPTDEADKKAEEATVPGGQCADSSIGLTVSPENPNATAGEPVTFITVVTNIGTVPCVRDLSGPLITDTVATVDGDQVWSNADCFPGTGSDIRTLKPGEQAQFKMVWAGTSSGQGCEPGQREQLPAGVYAVTAHVGNMASDPVPFNIH